MNEDVEPVGEVLDADLSVALVQLMSVVPNNIHTLLATTEGTESSSNLGLLTFTEDTIGFTCFMRSSSTYQSEQITLINTALAELSGFDLDIPVEMATWPLKADNKLGDIAVELFEELTGGEFTLHAIHAGVECGEFAVKNEDMYILATGVSGGSNRPHDLGDHELRPGRRVLTSWWRWHSAWLKSAEKTNGIGRYSPGYNRPCGKLPAGPVVYLVCCAGAHLSSTPLISLR